MVRFSSTYGLNDSYTISITIVSIKFNFYFILLGSIKGEDITRGYVFNFRTCEVESE